MPPDTRPYESPLRERQAEQTRQLILEALAEVISAQGPEDFSVQDVADQAGVAHRTVYRHFTSRQALLDALTDWTQEQLEQRGRGHPPDQPIEIDTLLEIIPQVFATFEELGAPAKAMAIMGVTGRVRAQAHDQRTEAFRAALEDELADLPEEEAEELFAVIRHLVSAQTWLVLNDEFGLDGERAGRAVATAVRVLVESARRRDG